MAISDDQQRFLEQLARRIPVLFDAIRSGNIKSEYIIGIRRIGQRHVQLKLIAEVVDAGANPLQTHGMQAPVAVTLKAALLPPSVAGKPVETGDSQGVVNDSQTAPGSGDEPI